MLKWPQRPVFTNLLTIRLNDLDGSSSGGRLDWRVLPGRAGGPTDSFCRRCWRGFVLETLQLLGNEDNGRLFNALNKYI